MCSNLKRIFMIILTFSMILALVSCGSSSIESNSSVSEETNESTEGEVTTPKEISTSEEDDLVIVSYELEQDEYSSDYYNLYVKIRNNTNQAVTYESIHYRCLDADNTVVDTFSAMNQQYESCDLDAGQMCIQDNLFAYEDNLARIEIDSYEYTTTNGEFVEKDFNEKYIIDITEFLAQNEGQLDETEDVSFETDNHTSEATSTSTSFVIDEIMNRFAQAWKTSPDISMSETNDIVIYSVVSSDNNSFYIAYTQSDDGTNIIKIAPVSLDETTGTSDWMTVVSYMAYAVDTDMEHTYDGMSIYTKVYDEGSATKNGIYYYISDEDDYFTILF